jgi:pimeloyl-CoA synthetase
MHITLLFKTITLAKYSEQTKAAIMQTITGEAFRSITESGIRVIH